MNSYYSNKIEGHSTHPINIARGLAQDFSSKPEIAKLQRLALAHIEAEIEIENRINQQADFSPFSAEGIKQIHAALYKRLSLQDRTTEDGVIVLPGALRTTDVSVGQHVAPTPDSLPQFLKRYEQVYSASASWDKQLVMIAAAHHRLTWIHPFIDGNGRVARLATHAALYRDFTSGLWSICRGFAKTQAEYYMNLMSADASRQGDLDGRGNLTDKGLFKFCHYFLTTCLDQLNFMNHMLGLDKIKKNITALLIYRSQEDSHMRNEAALPLHYLFTAGQLTRAEFKQMTGLGDKVAQILLSRLQQAGLVVSDTPLGPVRFGIPLNALQFYFPNLYPEASTELLKP
jgi:Fic family protein